MGRGPPVGRTPSRLPHRGFARVPAGAAEAVRRRRRAPAAATPTAARWGHGGEAGAGAERHADDGDAGLSSGAKDVGARDDWVGGGSKPRAVVPLVRRPLAWSAWRKLRKGDCTGLPWWPPCGVGEKVVKKGKKAVLVWRDSGVGVGGIVSEQCCLLSEHPQKTHVSLLSIFRFASPGCFRERAFS